MGLTPERREAFERGKAERHEQESAAKKAAQDAPPLSFANPDYPEHLLPEQFKATMDRVRREMQGELGGRAVELSDPDCDRVPCMVTLTIELSADEAQWGVEGTDGIGDEIGDLFQGLVGWPGAPPATMRGVYEGRQSLSVLYLPYSHKDDPVLYAQQDQLIPSRFTRPPKSLLQELMELFF